MGFLDYDTIRISKKPMPMKFSTLYNEEETLISTVTGTFFFLD